MAESAFDIGSLLRAIALDPEDLSLRLSLAASVEPGDPTHARFIRVQCELASVSRWDARRRELAEEEGALLRAHRRDWIADIPPSLGEPIFRRGCVEGMRVFGGEKANALLAAWSGLAARHPLREVHLHGTSYPTAETSVTGEWEGTFAAAGTIEALLQVAGSRLRRLHVLDAPVAKDTCAALAGATQTALEALELWNVGASAVQLEQLGRLAATRSLRRLSLGIDPIDGAGAAAVARGDWTRTLEELRLCGPTVDARVVAALGDGVPFLTLRRLSFLDAEIGELGARQLLGASRLSTVRDLDVPGRGGAGNSGTWKPPIVNAGPSGAQRLLDQAPRWQSLDLSWNGLDDTVLLSMTERAAALRDLAFVDLSFNAFSRETVEAVLAAHPTVTLALDGSLSPSDLGDLVRRHGRRVAP